MKRALEDGVLEVTEGDEGKPVITLHLPSGDVIIYESLVTAGELVVEVDAEHVTYAPPASPIPGVKVYHSDATQ